MINYNYIAIEGNIGAGKTTLAHKIAEDYNAHLILEQFEENPFLPKFYEEPEKYAFQVELTFLADRYHQLHNQLTRKDLFKTFTVADYYFMKSLIFARTTLGQDEFNLFRKIFDIINNMVVKPDLYVYLHMNIDNLMINIKKRGRSYEQSIEKSYLQQLQDGYFDFFKKQTDFKFLLIDINNIDFVSNAEHYVRLKQVIFETEYKKGINHCVL